jgi:hypothetical protein
VAFARQCDNNELMSSGPNWPVIRDFGVIDIDWSNSKQEWINTDPMTCEENLLKQAQLIKAKNPLGKGQKVWVYRNTVRQPQVIAACSLGPAGFRHARVWTAAAVASAARYYSHMS